MISTRTTNLLLLIIAISLVTIAAKPLLMAIFPEAKAQPENQSQLYGCYRSPENNECQWTEIKVDIAGNIIVSN